MVFKESGSLVLGIDTGGTYTDGVLLDYRTREVLATTKTLTTRNDLTQCVTEALNTLPIPDPSQIKLVSISTTLATNAIAEERGRRVALVLIGYDPELVQAYRLAERFGTRLFRYFKGGHTIEGAEQAPLEEEAIVEWIEGLVQRNEIDSVAISSYFSPLNNSHEERVAAALARVTDLPIVLGHELSMDLDSVQRATTATLNASLLSILQDFIIAVQAAIQRRGINAPLMVVKGDGTLVSADAVARRPVETVHSGPAASAVGARFLSGLDRALVIDIGGTTTDLAVIDDGQVMISDRGAVVGEYRTAVRGAALRSIGLGGDSHIRLTNDQDLIIGPQRVVPLSYLAHVHPEVHHQLVSLGHRAVKDIAPDDLEYWRLACEPNDALRARHPMVSSLLDLLTAGPRSLRDILRQLGLVHIIQLPSAVRDLLREERIERAGITPTDLLHVTGVYAPWDVAAAQAAVGALCRLTTQTMSELNESVLSLIAENITREVLTYLTHKNLPSKRRWKIPEDIGNWFFQNSLHPSHPYLKTRIVLDMPIIGIGAPAHIFLKRVAEFLHTDLALPPHYSVANAVGAVSGSVVIQREAVIYPQFYEMNIVGYYAQAGDGRRYFTTLEAAIEYASQVVGQAVLAEALAGGATTPELTIRNVPDGPNAFRVRARAVGTPSLGGRDWPRSLQANAKGTPNEDSSVIAR